MNNPLISIIVPVYNVEKYLPICIDSIIHQTYRNLEILLIDDGSPDQCGKICDEYILKDKRIKVIHKVNGGLSDARNVALDISTGKYITFVDSDDYVTPNYIEALYENLIKYNADISVSLLQEITQTGKIRDKKTKKYDCQLSTSEALSTMFYQRKFDTQACSKLYKANLFDHIRYPKGLLFEDLATTYKLILESKRIAYTNSQNYYYLLRSDSIEGTAFNMKKYDSAVKIVSVMDNDKERFPFASKAYYCRRTSFLFHILLQMPNSYRDHRNHIFNMIKQHRFLVIIDTHARIKARLACLLSFCGLRFVSFLFKLTSHR